MTKSRGFDISRNLPKSLIDEVMYFDTNSMLILLDPQHKDHHTILDFFQKGINTGVYFSYSSHTIEEARKVIKRTYLADKHNFNDPKQANRLSSRDLRAMNSYINQKTDDLENFMKDDAEIIGFNSKEVERNTRTIIDVNPTIHYEDAKHMQIMRENGVNSMVTQDQGFIKTKGYNFYGSSREIVRDHHINSHSAIIPVEEAEDLYIDKL